MALAGHRDATVRRELAAEADQDQDLLTLLVSDLDPLVAEAARWQLDHRLTRAIPVPAGSWFNDESDDDHDTADGSWTPSWGAD